MSDSQLVGLAKDFFQNSLDSSPTSAIMRGHKKYFDQKKIIKSLPIMWGYEKFNIKKNITGKKIKSIEVLIKVASDNQNQN